jgi:iron complex transport system ATP-binding protein
MPILTVSGLTVRRGTTVILDQISWAVTRGEHWVILGANGSGKTSLLSALTGYLTPTAGAVEVLSQHYGRTDWRELRKRVGLVSSSTKWRLIPSSAENTP